MNKYRIFYLLEILQKRSDEKHYLTSNDLIDYLKNDYDITVERKTIFDDVKTLNKLGFKIESKPNKGFYLSYYFFEIYEIKMLLDGIESMVNINDKEYIKLQSKLLNFLSINNQKFIKKITTSLTRRSSNSYQMAIILEGIYKEEFLKLTTNKQKEVTIIPYLLHFNLGYYYLYYAYQNKPQTIYTIRLDRIVSIKYTNEQHHMAMLFEECRKRIDFTVNNFYKEDEKWLDIIILNNQDYILDNLIDTFKVHTLTKFKNTYKFSLKASLSNELYANLCKYHKHIKILDDNYRQQYIDFLNSIINTQNYQP